MEHLLVSQNLNTMYYYNAYGMGIQSQLVVSNFTRIKGNADLKICFGDFEYSSSYAVVTGDNFIVNKDHTILFWEDIGAFKVKDGKTITFKPAPDAKEDDILECISGPVMAILLQQRGYLMLHASAVEIDGRVAAFLGRSGQGKSTSAAALYLKGHSIVADDVMGINFNESGFPEVSPGFPYIKLSSESESSLMKNSSEKIAKSDKRYKPAFNGFLAEPLPLKNIYILQKGEKTEISDLNPRDALFELVKYSYCIRLFKDGQRSENLIQCADLMRHVSVKRLEVCHSFEDINELQELIENDVKEGM